MSASPVLLGVSATLESDVSGRATVYLGGTAMGGRLLADGDPGEILTDYKRLMKLRRRERRASR